MSHPVVSPNFAFLAAHDPLLADYGARAERYVFEDPAIALVKLRQMGELFAQQAAAYTGLNAGSETPQIDLIRRLQDANVVERDVGGFAEPGIGRRIGGDFEALVARAARLGLAPEAVRAALPRLRGGGL